MPTRHLRPLDRLLDAADNALRTLAADPHSTRPPPAPNLPADKPEPELSAAEKQHSARLMRVNHTGEVCAQALYQGQALTAKLPQVRADMEQAAAEEADHLAWCAARLAQLDSRTSYLNPLFYGLSFGLGAVAGLLGDRLSLGFIAATEEQVCQHLRTHQQQLPAADKRSRAIVAQMLEDEEKHGQSALAAGGLEFPPLAKRAMTAASRAMTQTVAHI
ncbi:MAG: 2-polyprenyl-3-methyl-6-methoxy-1,4-benzoquinone monooxygenase [Cellvibrionales bacterium]|nr:2-polyprenyl-3-methyl-6-methoxy-1,4-benzoquinone monooxygenase [Cellvibrionales bacterium]